MSCLGVHFALTEKEVAHLRSLDDEQGRLEHLQEVSEDHYLNHEKQFAAESDKSWDAMHRALSDGEMSWDGGDYPLDHTVLAGELLYTDSDYIMSLKKPEQVRDIAAALAELKNAPARVKRVAGFGALLSVLVLLSFCASAFTGHVRWGRALASGVLQFLLLWFVSFSVQARHRWAWWALLVLVALRLWGGLGHTMRIVRITIEGGLAGHGREIAFDAIGVAQFVISGVLLWLLFSREVRDYVHKTVA